MDVGSRAPDVRLRRSCSCFADRGRAELEARRAALMTVTTTALREARDACVSVLREDVENRRDYARQEAAAGARDQARDRR